MASADGSAPTKDTTDQMAPIQCASGCGFFGNAATGNMCSKCFKESCAKAKASTEAPSAASKPETSPQAPAPQQVVAAQAAAASPAAPAAPPAVPVDVSEPSVTTPPVAPVAKEPAPAASPSASVAPPAVAPAAAVSAPSEEEEEPPRKVQANKSRCWTCNRKIGLLGFQCKCEYFFCAEHRYSDRHECFFDYKAQGKQLLTKANPTIAASKMESL